MNTHGQKTEVFCQREPWWRKVCFYIKETKWSPDRIETAVGLPVTMKVLTAEHEGMEYPPAFELADEQAQQFIDELWRVGFRPSEGSGSAGSLAATERHLADMRALVFKTGVPK